METRGHDEVVKNIQKMGKGEVRITENRIKEIHKTIIFDKEDKPEFRRQYLKNNFGNCSKNEN